VSNLGPAVGAASADSRLLRVAARALLADITLAPADLAQNVSLELEWVCNKNWTTDEAVAPTVAGVVANTGIRGGDTYLLPLAIAEKLDIARGVSAGH
jgi:uncharacterized caspase-like protein